MEQHSIIFTVFLIFAGAAVFSTLALYMRQSLLVAYMLFGIVFGPWGFKAISDIALVNKVDEIGIVFFMFLLGMQLHPHNLLRAMSKTVWVTLVSSLVFFALGSGVGYFFGYSLGESLIVGSCMMFSSTIVSLKLLSSEEPKNQRTSDLMIGILLLQDLIAIIVLLVINTASHGRVSLSEIILITLSLPALLVFVFLTERFVLRKIFAKFSEVREYILLIAVAWCLGIAELATVSGLSYEIGAFVAGLAIAASPISLYIGEQLKPIRDFFLVLFFFIIGASFNIQYSSKIFAPALLLTGIFIFVKPMVFYFLISRTKEAKETAKEIGIRLGQLSEFSLLIIFLAYRSKLVSNPVIYLIQAVTMLTIITSSFLVVSRYPDKVISKAASLPENSKQLD